MASLEKRDIQSEFLLKLFSEIASRLKTEYKYSNDELFALSEDTLLIPASIFAGKLTPTEALTKYLRENCELSYRDISKLINRNEKGVWLNYQRAKGKSPDTLNAESRLNVPVSVFYNDNLTIFEALVVYLRDVKKMKNSMVARLLNRNHTNIWMVYKKGKTKCRLI